MNEMLITLQLLSKGGESSWIMRESSRSVSKIGKTNPTQSKSITLASFSLI